MATKLVETKNFGGTSTFIEIEVPDEVLEELPELAPEPEPEPELPLEETDKKKK